jgi:feruloyl esterase
LAAVPDAPTQIVSATPVGGRDGSFSHCQVDGYVSPNINFRLLLPARWNGRLLEVGCGGHCGIIDDKRLPFSCADVVSKGYACVASDMGHTGTGLDGVWAYNNLQAKIDWGYRATHVVALSAKAVVERYYDKAPQKSYFAGCSTGGRQALQEAQHFPWDFDGIIAGAPPVDLSTIYLRFAWGIRAGRDANDRPLLQPNDLKLLSEAVLAKCDLDDGLQDGIVTDPLHCKFDPAELECKAPETQNCLSREAVNAAEKIYKGPMTSGGTRLSSGGPAPGSEASGWNAYLSINGTPPDYEQLTADGFRYLLFQPAPGPTWKLGDFDFDRDYKRLDTMQFLYDSSNPDLTRFQQAGGKLLVYQGLNDTSVLPQDTIAYYDTVERTMGGRTATQSFLRLFVLPAVDHCSGGAGADTVDYLNAIESWVERGQAPDKLIAAHVNGTDRTRPFWLGAEGSTVRFTRPVYPYPLKPRYKGSGNPNEADSFVAVQ